MANRIVLKRSSVALKVPLAGDLVVGELAVNLTDKLLYTKDAGGNVVAVGGSGGGGSGTVTAVSVVTANGVSATVATSTTTPALTLSLGAITPASVASVGAVSGSNLSGTNTGDQSLASLGAYAATNPSGYTSNTGTVTGVTATGPVVSSGGTAPVISMAAATTSVPGYLTAADWTTFNAKQAALGYTPYNAGANTVLTNANYTSYAPSLTGSGASGTWGINVTGSSTSCSGNAATVSNGVYTNSSAAISGNNYLTFGPNSSWGAYIRIGGNGRTLTTGSSVTTTNGNLHLDSADGTHLYLNYYAGGTIYLLGGTYTISNGGANYNGNAATSSSCSGNAATTSQRTFSQVRTDGINQGSYGAITISGNNNGYSGINFSDYSSTLMWNSTYQGCYINNNTWQWGFANGVLTWGSVPGTLVTGNIGGSASNITAYTINQSLGTSNAPTFADVYTNGWFRCTGSQGLYNGTHGNHFYANDNAWWNVAGNNGSIVGIRLRTGGHDGAIRGHLYANDGNNIGFLTQDGNWQIRCNNSEVELYDVTYTNDLRTFITYDRNDTAYYCDPNGTSELSTLTAATRTRWDMPSRTFNRQQHSANSNYWTGTRGWGTTINWNQAWKYGFGGFDIWGENTAHPQGAGYIHAQGICSGLHHVDSDGNGAYGFQLVGGTNASDRLWYRGAWGNSGNTWREIPMFDVNSGNGSWMWFAGWYDNNNSGYYVDPNGTSRMGTINADALNSYGNVIAYYSDERLKTIKGPILNAVEKLSQIDGFYYTGNNTAKSFGYDTEKLQLGVSAQKVELIFPELIERAPCSDKVNGVEYKTLDYSKLVPVLIEAIKEQQAQITELRRLIATN